MKQILILLLSIFSCITSKTFAQSTIEITQQEQINSTNNTIKTPTSTKQYPDLIRVPTLTKKLQLTTAEHAQLAEIKSMDLATRIQYCQKLLSKSSTPAAIREYLQDYSKN